MPDTGMKIVTIAGFGYVGSTVAWMLLNDVPGTWHINILDPDQGKEGLILDLLHATHLHRNKLVSVNDHDLFLRSDYIVHAAGGSSTITSDRTEVLNESIEITREIFGNKVFSNKDLRIIVVTNPVDTIARYTSQFTGLSPSVVTGTGTLLDSMRLAYYASLQLEVHPSRIHATVLGEHGNSMVPLTSNIFLDGENINDTRFDHQALTNETRNAAFEIKKTSPATYLGIASCVQYIIHSYENRTESVPHVLSVMINDEYRSKLHCDKNIYIGLPVKYDTDTRTFHPYMTTLSDKEFELLSSSAHVLEQLVN